MPRKQPRGPGRPPIGPQARRGLVWVRVDIPTTHAIGAAARRAQVPRPDWIRAAIEAALDGVALLFAPPTPEEPVSRAPRNFGKGADRSAHYTPAGAERFVQEARLAAEVSGKLRRNRKRHAPIAGPMVDAGGIVRTSRYGGFSVEDLAGTDPAFLCWILSTSEPLDPAVVRRARIALLKSAYRPPAPVEDAPDDGLAG